jgi:hypothetical protein
MNDIFQAERYTDRNLIESILASFYINDYGYIKKVNPDKTVDVIHAKMLKTMDGQSLRPTTTKALEVLTLSCGGFALQVDYKAGDKVLLLGLKDYVPKTQQVAIPTETTSYLHYTRETMKALPLCVFDNTAKVQVKTEEGTLQVNTTKNIELNGNTKQFVTYEELNSALQDLWTKIKSHTHPVSTTGTSSAQSGTASASQELSPVNLDISASKTTTVVTGG